MNLKARLTVALNETRMLMMGAQILFGFQFQGVFQPLTERASGTAHALQALGLVLMASCLTLLIAVPSYHRLGERGEATGRVVGLVTALTGWALLPLGLPYIGLLGPRKRAEKLLTDLRTGGLSVSDEALHTLHAPVGLDLGGDTPEAVALSILAELQARLQGRDARPLRNRNRPIHD